MILVTGAAGFIGMHVAEALLKRGEWVIGLDNLNPYYDPALKRARLARLEQFRGFSFHNADVSDREAVAALMRPEITAIIHLAAQAGVRHSLVDPYAYVQANVMGHLVIQEAARRLPRLSHLIYASSSSVYGANRKLPFSENDRVDRPVSLYAATKRADELMSEAYAHLFGLPQTGLRFFTVYGPWGRPDMAYYAFARAIAAGRPITLYDGGRLKRDFTYIDDIVSGLLGVVDKPPGGDEPPCRVLNIGNHRAEEVRTLVRLLEEGLGRQAMVIDAPAPETEVRETFADVAAIGAVAGFRPSTPLEEGITRFVDWFRAFHAGSSEPQGGVQADPAV